MLKGGSMKTMVEKVLLNSLLQNSYLSVFRDPFLVRVLECVLASQLQVFPDDMDYICFSLAPSLIVRQ